MLYDHLASFLLSTNSSSPPEPVSSFFAPRIRVLVAASDLRTVFLGNTLKLSASTASFSPCPATLPEKLLGPVAACVSIHLEIAQIEILN